MSLQWKIYYGDGTTFSNEDGGPEDAPADNVQVIGQRNSTVGREVLCEKDFYVFEDNTWVAMDDDGMKAYFRRVGLLKQAETMPTEKFRKLYSLAVVDPELPRKSAKFSFAGKGNE
jgi:hypothetical protein